MKLAYTDNMQKKKIEYLGEFVAKIEITSGGWSGAKVGYFSEQV
jgi:hypothetical protein